jgi:hypothetical protein
VKTNVRKDGCEFPIESWERQRQRETERERILRVRDQWFNYYRVLLAT